MLASAAMVQSRQAGCLRPHSTLEQAPSTDPILSIGLGSLVVKICMLG